jgi:hypothetical protein
LGHWTLPFLRQPLCPNSGASTRVHFCNQNCKLTLFDKSKLQTAVLGHSPCRMVFKQMNPPVPPWAPGTHRFSQILRFPGSRMWLGSPLRLFPHHTALVSQNCSLV